MRPDDALLARALADTVTPLKGAAGHLDELVTMLAGAPVVLLGEASHGTHEFYRIRAELTRRLIAEHGFLAVAAEADWPDAYRVNRFVRGVGRDQDAATALSDFRRFPPWMWRNQDVLAFVAWLRAHNHGITDPARRAGFYGLDVYSLHSSIQAVLAYLDRVDHPAALRARYRYACFEQFGEDPQAYGYAAEFGLSQHCEEEAVAELLELEERRRALVREGGVCAVDEAFDAEQNALVVKDAERYYRTMFGGRVSSWNLRDTHMADTLDGLLRHLGQGGVPPKIIVWAHNSHVGDARATEMGEQGEITLGQLARERHPGARLLGFTTHRGTVTAAQEWGAVGERMGVRPALGDSYEALFHDTGVPRFWLDLRHLGEVLGALYEPRLSRAIGVVYRPETERLSHYLHCRLPAQYHAIIHLDHTHALEPLEPSAEWQRGEPPETYPSGL